ncbi:MAG: hypothetical protein GVY20_03280 [Bacteroidetes bacterium]|jgi:hypothetical protein|nr:hypothetical protein [Bacteroidota bacterium]
MKAKTVRSNVLVLFSAVFFLVASAFSLPSANADNMASGANFGCFTCTFSPSGAPIGCTTAQYCGMTQCWGSCDMSGVLCGECAGGGGNPGEPGETEDPGGN